MRVAYCRCRMRDMCRMHGLGQGTSASSNPGMEVSDAAKLRAFTGEAARLTRLLADAMLDSVALKDLPGKPTAQNEQPRSGHCGVMISRGTGPVVLLVPSPELSDVARTSASWPARVSRVRGSHVSWTRLSGFAFECTNSEALREVTFRHLRSECTLRTLRGDGLSARQ